MTKTVLNFALLFVLLVLAQVIVFNHLTLWGTALPLVFIYWIMRLPVTTGPIMEMSLAFLIGLAVDVFSDTPGQNALSCTVLSVLRKPVLKLYFPREEDLSDPEPSAKSLGAAVFMKYVVTLTAIYSIMFFVIEAFTFFNPLRLVMHIVFSTILSFLLVIAIDSLTHISSEKRL